MTTNWLHRRELGRACLPYQMAATLAVVLAALASNPLNPTSMAQFHCVVNTVISLIGACLSAFVASGYFCNQFDMVHIQVPCMCCATGCLP